MVISVQPVLIAALAVIAVCVYLCGQYGVRPAWPFGSAGSTFLPPDLPPAVVGALMRSSRLTEDDVIATLLDLVRRGVLVLDAVPAADVFALGRPLLARPAAPASSGVGPTLGSLDAGWTYRFTLRRERLAGLRPYEGAVVAFFFSGQFGSADAFTTDRYRAVVRQDTSAFNWWFRWWRQKVLWSPEAKGLLIPEGMRAQRTAAFLLLGSVVLVFLGFGAPWSALPAALVAVVACWWTMLHLPGRTPRGAALLVHYRALSRQLTTTRISEMTPTGVVPWNEYFIMATVFGHARETIADMYALTPNFLQKLGIQVLSQTSPRRQETAGERQFREAISQHPVESSRAEVEGAYVALTNVDPEAPAARPWLD
jgi:hypothetical protein